MLFENLLISSFCGGRVFGGGLFLLYDGKIHRLDLLSTTGFFCGHDIAVRGIHPKHLAIYDKNYIIQGDTIDFDDIHDVFFVDNYYYIVSTANNTIIKLSRDGELVQKWIFPGENDSWHINCLGYWQGRVIFSAFGKFSKHREWKNRTARAGFIQDLYTGEVIITSLSQPHSLRTVGDNLILANSENGEILEISPGGEVLRSKKLNGYTRGISVDINNNVVYVGLSVARDINTSWVQTANIVALDLETFNELGRLVLPVNEIYDIQLAAKEKIISFLADNSYISYEIIRAVLAEIAKTTHFKVYYSYSEGYDENNTLLKNYYINWQQTKIVLKLPHNISRINNLRFDPATVPSALILHRLAFLDIEENEFWSWDGKAESLFKIYGLTLYTISKGLCLLCYNDDPQFELAIPDDIFQRLGPGCTIEVEITPKPLADVIPEVFAQNNVALPVIPNLQSTIQPYAPIANDLARIIENVEVALRRRDEIIARQREELVLMRCRQQTLHEQLIRAEAQLDLLKQILFEQDARIVRS